MMSNIKIKKINDDISLIIINEPKAYNALSFKNLTDLIKAFKKLDSDKRVKVIIIPDIESVNYGRGVGYDIIEHIPPEDIKKISAKKFIMDCHDLLSAFSLY